MSKPRLRIKSTGELCVEEGGDGFFTPKSAETSIRVNLLDRDGFPTGTMRSVDRSDLEAE
jgi:hypothetical protein